MATDTPIPAPELLLSASDLARELRVSVKSVRRLDAMGKLPLPIKLGRLLRWRRDELTAWLAALVVIARAARIARDKTLERAARRELVEKYGIDLSFRREQTPQGRRASP